MSTINTSSLIYPYISLSSVLNNSGDYVVLFDSNGNIIDQYQYTSDPGSNITLGRSSDGGSWATLATASKGSSNGFSSSSTPSPSATSTSISFSISNVPSEINSDQSFSLNVSISSSNTNTEYFLKGAFKKSDSSNYFGETKVGLDWIKNGTSYSNQYKITTDASGNWSGSLEVRPDILDSGYDGAGAYIFKVGKYSTNSSLTWSNEVNIQIAAREVTEQTLNPIPTSSSKKKSLNKLPEAVYTLENYKKSASIAGEKVEPSPSSTVNVAGQEFKNPFFIIGGVLITLGICFFGFIIFKKWKAT